MFSGKHDNSVLGVANKDYDAAAIANEVMFRMFDRKVVDRGQDQIDLQVGDLPDHRLRLRLQSRSGAGREDQAGVLHLPVGGLGAEGRVQERGPLRPDHLQEGLERDPQDRRGHRRQIHLQVS